MKARKNPCLLKAQSHGRSFGFESPRGALGDVSDGAEDADLREQEKPLLKPKMKPPHFASGKFTLTQHNGIQGPGKLTSSGHCLQQTWQIFASAMASQSDAALIFHGKKKKKPFCLRSCRFWAPHSCYNSHRQQSLQSCQWLHLAKPQLLTDIKRCWVISPRRSELQPNVLGPAGQQNNLNFKRKQKNDITPQTGGTSGEWWNCMGGAEVQNCNPNYFFSFWSPRACENSIHWYRLESSVMHISTRCAASLLQPVNRQTAVTSSIK